MARAVIEACLKTFDIAGQNASSYLVGTDSFDRTNSLFVLAALAPSSPKVTSDFGPQPSAEKPL